MRIPASDVAKQHGTTNLVHARWDERVARARRLAAEYPSAAEILTFYAALAEYQKSLIQNLVVAGPHPRDLYLAPLALGDAFGNNLLSEATPRGTVPFFDAVDLEPVLAAIPDFLSWLQRAAPASLKQAAGEMRGLERSAWRHLIDSYLRPVDDLKPVTAFIVEAVLQPFAEQSAIRERSDTRLPTPDSRLPSSSACRCPSCGSLPVVGVLREEGQGAKRTLVCGLCLTERDYLRVVCPGCEEQRFDALPVYTAGQFEHVRIEACDSCRTYLKTIDLTKNGLAVPLVDDIASVTMDLWARDGGYTRLRPNLLRM